MSKSIYNKFVDKAKCALIAAVEIYNKPTFSYREETFAILAINAWELLLKAKILKDSKNDVRAIRIYETIKRKDGQSGKRQVVVRNRVGNPKTISLHGCISKIQDSPGKIDAEIVSNIYALVEVRDNSTHYISASSVLSLQVLEISCATIKNFILLAKDWFNRDFSDTLSLLLPLSFIDSTKEVESVWVSNDEGRLIGYLESLAKSRSASDGKYSVAIKVDIKFEKSSLSTASKVITSKDPSAISVTFQDEDIRKKYPWDYKELTDRLRKRYRDFKQDPKFHSIRKPLMSDERFAKPRYLDPGNPKSPLKYFYNNNILQEFDKIYSK